MENRAVFDMEGKTVWFALLSADVWTYGMGKEDRRPERRSAPKLDAYGPPVWFKSSS